MLGTIFCPVVPVLGSELATKRICPRPKPFSTLGVWPQPKQGWGVTGPLEGSEFYSGAVGSQEKVWGWLCVPTTTPYPCVIDGVSPVL